MPASKPKVHGLLAAARRRIQPDLTLESHAPAAAAAGKLRQASATELLQWAVDQVPFVSLVNDQTTGISLLSGSGAMYPALSKRFERSSVSGASNATAAGSLSPHLSLFQQPTAFEFILLTFILILALTVGVLVLKLVEEARENEKPAPPRSIASALQQEVAAPRTPRTPRPPSPSVASHASPPASAPPSLPRLSMTHRDPYAINWPAVLFQDPRHGSRHEIGIIGFAARACAPADSGRLDSPDACASLCGGVFLGLGFPCGGILVPSVSLDGARREMGPFESAEDALTALNGHGDWRATAAVLYSKFKRGSACAAALRATGDAFLLEHGGDRALEQVWAGRGANRLGLQLMIIRAELARDEDGEVAPSGEPVSWTEFARDVCKIDLATGEQQYSGVHAWQTAIKSATSKIVLMLLSEYGGRGAPRADGNSAAPF